VNLTNPSFAVRTKASIKYGWGHLIRTLRLTSYLERTSPEISVTVVAEGDSKVEDTLIQWGQKYTKVPSNPSLEDEIKWMDQIAPDIIIVDLLNIEPNCLKLYKQICKKLICFSDLGYSYPEADIVICPQVLSKYPDPEPGQVFLTGPDYFILDDSFKNLDIPREIAPKINNLLVVMGGSLSTKSEMWINNLIDGLGNQNFKTNFIMGFDRAGLIDTTRYQNYSQITFIEGTNKLGQLMKSADLAVGAGGYVKLELAASGTPALLVSIVDHQDSLAKQFADQTEAARYLGPINEVTSTSIIQTILSLSDNYEARSSMSRAGIRLVDGKGIYRIADTLFSSL